MSETFERVWTVRFSDTDPFGIAHYPRIVDALHETSDMFMQEAGFPYWELAEQGFGLPLVQVDLTFSAPVEAGDDVTIALTAEYGTTSVRFDYRGTKADEEVFSGYEQRVCAEKDGGPMAVPEDLRAALDRYAGD